jgi:heat shock protein HslJ
VARLEVISVSLFLFAEHGQHATRDREAAEHVDGRQRQRKHRQAQDQRIGPVGGPGRVQRRRHLHQGADDAPLTGTKWTLESIVANDAVSSLPTGVTPPTLDIADDGTVTFSTGCNSGGGSVVIGDFDGEGVLDFGVMRVTLMACEGDGAPVEASVLAVLDGEVEVSIDGQVLTLTNGGQGLQYRAS